MRITRGTNCLPCSCCCRYLHKPIPA